MRAGWKKRPVAGLSGRSGQSAVFSVAPPAVSCVTGSAGSGDLSLPGLRARFRLWNFVRPSSFRSQAPEAVVVYHAGYSCSSNTKGYSRVSSRQVIPSSAHQVWFTVLSSQSKFSMAPDRPSESSR